MGFALMLSMVICHILHCFPALGQAALTSKQETPPAMDLNFESCDSPIPLPDPTLTLMKRLPHHLMPLEAR